MKYCVTVNIQFNKCKCICIDEVVLKNYRYKYGNNKYIQLTAVNIYKYKI